MPRRVRASAAVYLCVAALCGCSVTTPGTPTAADPEAPAAVTPSAAPPITTAAPTPTGRPIGEATMKVVGGPAPVTIRYRINGGEEQTETDVVLPWEKVYPVYDEIESSVTAEGGDGELMCSIIMDGKLAALMNGETPTCSFAYWG